MKTFNLLQKEKNNSSKDKNVGFQVKSLKLTKISWQTLGENNEGDVPTAIVDEGCNCYLVFYVHIPLLVFIVSHMHNDAMCMTKSKVWSEDLNPPHTYTRVNDPVILL